MMPAMIIGTVSVILGHCELHTGAAMTRTYPGAGVAAERPRQPPADLEAGNTGLVGSEEGLPVLLGSQCQRCSEQFFPPVWVCPACTSFEIEQASLGSTGVLYSYSTVHVSPSRPTPYTLGYVDLDAGPRVLSHVRWSGEGLELDVQVVLKVDEQLSTWWFEPIGSTGGHESRD